MPYSVSPTFFLNKEKLARLGKGKENQKTDKTFTRTPNILAAIKCPNSWRIINREREAKNCNTVDSIRIVADENTTYRALLHCF